MLELKNISASLGDFFLEDISFEVSQGDYFMLLGESGAGKTVILEIIAGLKKAQKGDLFLYGKSLQKVPIQKRNVGIVYQNHALFPHLNVFENIAYSLSSSQKKEVLYWADIVGAESLLYRSVNTLSGGEAQRVALARTLARKPDLLLLDEPLASLDIVSSHQIRMLLRKLHRLGQTFIHVTHNYEEALSLGTKLGVLEKGKMVQKGTPQEVFNHPQTPFLAHFTGHKNFFKASFFQEKLHINISYENIFIKSSHIVFNKKNPEDLEFKGTILDIERTSLGMEICLSSFEKFYALIPQGESFLGNIGQEISFFIHPKHIQPVKGFL